MVIIEANIFDYRFSNTMLIKEIRQIDNKQALKL